MFFIVLGTTLTTTVHAQDAKQRLFERVFGDAVKLDPAMVAKVKAAKPGERLFVDRDGDGKNDEVWYIDTAVRHTEQVGPILVRAIDEDGDLDEHLGPDLDSDLYVADWKADGTVDVLLDYQDNDGDDDLDEMAFYFYMKRHGSFGDDVLRVWWGRDDSDDNLLWHDVDYTYYQGLCQYRCHFSGDELVVAFGLTEGKDRWVSAFENPFLFYDPDGDDCSEVVLRISGRDDAVRSARYSFDVDDDAYGQRTHDYDFSITTRAPEDKPVLLPKEFVKEMKLRGIPTQAWLQREHARKFVENAPWQVAVLTWDEMNANTEGNVERDPHERWEGIIAHPSKHFKQVGGPACSPLNKRNEVALKPVAPMRLYYDPTDHRLHLVGANEGWLHVDYDFDGNVDAKYTYVDEDQDGYFDRRQLDLDADGKVDFDWEMGDPGRFERSLDLTLDHWPYRNELNRVLEDSQRFVDQVKRFFSVRTGAEPIDPAERFFLDELPSWMAKTGLGAHMRKSPAGARFYMDLVRDRMFQLIREHYAGADSLPGEAIEAFYATGRYREAADVIEYLVSISSPYSATPRRTPSMTDPFTLRIPLVVGAGDGLRIDQPVSIPVREIRAKAPDFNPANCAIVAPDRWLDWRQVPHQTGQIDAAVGEEISFLVDRPNYHTGTYWLYYAADGERRDRFAQRTGTAEDWVPPNIGWESNRCAYRAYWGQFDFFGKKTDQLIYGDIGATSYHKETEWGIDALHVGKASGLGGLTLYMGGKAYLVQNPAGDGNVEFTKRVITEGPVRSAIEFVARNVVPEQPDLTVRVRCIIYAERQESEIRVKVTGADSDVTLAPGLVKLPRERFFADREHGCFGSWGWQETVIGEIGMGLIVPPDRVVDVLDLPEERRVQCRPSDDGELRYWIIGDWRRGRQYPVAPTIDNWAKELRQLATLLLNDVRIEIGGPERMPHRK